MSMDSDEEADNSSEMAAAGTKQRRKTKKVKNFNQMPDESFYLDMQQFDDQSTVSVEDIDLATQSYLREDGDAEIQQAEEFQSYLKAKLNLDVFRIPILYLKWYFDASHSGLIQIQEQPRAQPDKSIRIIEFSEQKYQL